MFLWVEKQGVTEETNKLEVRSGQDGSFEKL